MNIGSFLQGEMSGKNEPQKIGREAKMALILERIKALRGINFYEVGPSDRQPLIAGDNKSIF